MHQLAASAQSLAGRGGDVVVVVAMVMIAANLVRMFVRQRQRTSQRRPAQAPGDVTGYRERDEISGGPPDDTGPDAQAPGVQPGRSSDHSCWREESVGRQPHQGQARSYWEPEQEDGTLAPNGFIGDPAQQGGSLPLDGFTADQHQADPPPGQPDAGADGPAR